MIAPTHAVITKQSAFTLVEVLFAISISAILMGAIALSLGVQSDLADASKTTSPLATLSKRLDQIQETQLVSDLEALVGVSAASNPLSDPSGTTGQILVSVDNVQTGSNATAAQILAIKVSSGSSTLTRWLTPTEAP